jgi:hypothetical protein
MLTFHVLPIDQADYLVAVSSIQTVSNADPDKETVPVNVD